MMNLFKKWRPSFALRNERTFSIETLEERRLFAADTFAAAIALGSLEGKLSRTGTVTSSDQKDYYKFTMPRAGGFAMQLNGSALDADIYLYNSSQVEVLKATGPSSSDQNNLNIGAGTYYVLVQRYSGTTINYTLNLQTDFAGLNSATARNLGTLGSTALTAKDFVGSAAGQSDPADFYKVVLGSATDVNVNLSGMAANANVAILNSGGTTVASSSNTGTIAENIVKNLAAGTYYVKVTPASGASTNYALSVAKASWPDGAGNNRTLAKSLGVVSGAKQITGVGSTLAQEGITPADLDDFYKFVVGEAGTIKAQLSGLAGNLNVWFENSAGTVLTPKGLNTGTTAESISLYVQPGVYYARVFQGTTGVSSQYKLTLTCPLDAGSTNATAMEEFLYQPPWSDFLHYRDLTGHVSTNDATDIYKVNLQGYGDVSLKNAGDVNLYLYNSSGTLLRSSASASLDDESISWSGLPAGNYYFAVKIGSLSSATFYDLSINVYY